MLRILDEMEAMRREELLLLSRGVFPRGDREWSGLFEENKPLVLEALGMGV